MLKVITLATLPFSVGLLLVTVPEAGRAAPTIESSVAQPGLGEVPMTERSRTVQLAQATSTTATSASEKDDIHGVLSAYYETRDSAAASAFFGEPSLIVLPNQVVALATRADVEAFFDKLAASRKSSGYSHSNLGNHYVKLLNSTTAVYSAIAIRVKADGTEMQRSGFTYLLHKENAGWRIYSIVATDVDKLITSD